jgi:hypothetical protein
MNPGSIQNSLKQKLMSRYILFDFFVFDNKSVSIIVYASGPKLSVSIPYTIREHEDGSIELATNSWSSTCKSVETAITLLVRDSRTSIAKFKRYVQ